MSRIVAVFGILLLAFMAVYGVNAVFESSGEPFDVENESFSPNAGTVTDLDESHLSDVYYDERVTVRDGSGNVMEPDRDYRWFESNGTVKTLEGGRLDGETSATISYGWNRPTEGQETVASLAAMLLGNIEVLGFAFVLGMFLVYLRGGA